MFSVTLTPRGKALLLTKKVDFTTDVVKLVLSTSGGLIPSDSLSQASILPASGNYPAAGVLLSGVALAWGAAATDVAVIADNIAFVGITASFSTAFLYTPGTFTDPLLPQLTIADPLLAMISFGNTIDLDNADYTIVWESGRIINMV